MDLKALLHQIEMDPCEVNYSCKIPEKLKKMWDDLNDIQKLELKHRVILDIVDAVHMNRIDYSFYLKPGSE